MQLRTVFVLCLHWALALGSGASKDERSLLDSLRIQLPNENDSSDAKLVDDLFADRTIKKEKIHVAQPSYHHHIERRPTAYATKRGAPKDKGFNKSPQNVYKKLEVYEDQRSSSHDELNHQPLTYSQNSVSGVVDGSRISPRLVGLGQGYPSIPNAAGYNNIGSPYLLKQASTGDLYDSGYGYDSRLYGYDDYDSGFLYPQGYYDSYQFASAVQGNRLHQIYFSPVHYRYNEDGLGLGLGTHLAVECNQYHCPL